MFDWITSFLDSGGALAIAALMLLENVFPPIPSELIMPLAGFNAARGGTPLWLAILAGGLGSLAGAYFWYLAGRAFGAHRLRRLIASHGRWLTLTLSEFEAAEGWFQRHGRAVVFFGRFIPTVRTLISIPAGIERMPQGQFLLFTALGSFIWSGGLALAGYLLEDQYESVEHWIDPLSTAVVIGIIALYLWRVIRWKPDA
ncbi:DedA family protein [Paracoccus aerius]|uniref:DedA family protein n=1 Tax=Paracoccus aerius TaxID=1915382 RepID=A0ABS1S1X4_9RHOB|nr:DedA family protein [Paracoccus aerius]MBL3672144.1 DedA family protein [Paracoccus aerius]GHG12632.1 alkaline phosphatase [Paracoccus aerius]